MSLHAPADRTTMPRGFTEPRYETDSGALARLCSAIAGSDAKAAPAPDACAWAPVSAATAASLAMRGVTYVGPVGE